MRPRHVTNRTDSGGKEQDDVARQAVERMLKDYRAWVESMHNWMKRANLPTPLPEPPQGEPSSIEEELNNRILDWDRPSQLISVNRTEIYNKLIPLMERREREAYQAGLSAALGVLPEKHEQKINSPDDPDYDEKKARFYRDGGRNFALDEARQNIEKLKENK